MNELQLLAGCKEQNREAQKLLYETYSRKMYAICLRYCSDTGAAKDLLQDGFIKVFAHINSFEERGSFEGWMKRVFINLALENLRKKRWNIETEDIEKLPDFVDDATEDNDMYKISEVELLKMIHSLPTGYSTVFNLYAIEDYSHKEIAEMLNISEGTSRSQYVRARQILQTKVKQHLKDNA